MIYKTNGQLEWAEFPLLQQFSRLRHGVFSRLGGVSQGEFSSLNVSMMPQEDPNHVKENRQRIARVFGQEELISCRQVHGNIVLEVEDFWQSGDCGDGLIVKEPHKPVLISHADCQVAIFYDPVLHVLANVHCGWRGNVQNIYQKVVEKLCTLGSKKENIFVAISPSLGPAKAEFVRYLEEFPEEFLEFHLGNNYFHLWEISRRQLELAGILPEHIEIASICTYERSKEYFSYRREKVTGRNGTVAMLSW